jgi:hypothetical protein
MSKAERTFRYHHAYRVAMQDYGTYPKRYRIFFADLIKHDRQQFLDYIRNETVLSVLPVPVDDPKLFKKIGNLIAQHTTSRSISYLHFSFCLLLVFGLSLKVRVLSDQIKDSGFYPEEILELLRYADVLN